MVKPYRMVWSMKNVKLSAEQMRHWRAGRCDWVVDSETFEFKRYATAEELNLRNPEIEGCEVAEARTAIRMQLLKLHGTHVRVMNPQGRFLGSSRVTGKRGGGANGGSGAIDPTQCMCQKYAGTVLGTHHAVCVNRPAWEAHKKRSVPLKIVPAPNQLPARHIVAPSAHAAQNMKGQSLGVVPGAAKAYVTMMAPPRAVQNEVALNDAADERAVIVAAVTPSPDDCICAKWSAPPKDDPMQHNPMCEHRQAWQAVHHTVTKKAVLVDLDSGEQVREASAAEIAEAETAQRDDGAPLAVVDGRTYLVAMRKSA